MVHVLQLIICYDFMFGDLFHHPELFVYWLGKVQYNLSHVQQKVSNTACKERPTRIRVLVGVHERYTVIERINHTPIMITPAILTDAPGESTRLLYMIT